MKKIVILFLTIYIGTLSFSEVSDKINILQTEEKVKLEEKVKEVSEKTDLKVYVNYFEDKDAIELKEVEKSVIINFLKEDTGNLTVSVNLTQDVNIEEYRGNIENTLDNLEPFLVDGEYLEYSLELLGSLEEVILKSQAVDSEKEKEFKEQGKSKSKMLILFVFLGGLFYLRKRKAK